MKRSLLACLFACAWPIAADAAPQDEAVVLFDQGIKDMKAGKLAQACKELQSSLDLVKDSGTKGALAKCNGLAGRVATSWLLWRDLADTAPTPDLRNDAANQAKKIEPRLPRYTIKVAAPKDTLSVSIDGRPVDWGIGVAIPIDPGKVSVSASAPDTEVWTHDYTAVEGQTIVIDVPELKLKPHDIVKQPDLHPVPVPVPVVDERAESRHRRHVVALIIGGVAVVGIGGGAYFGLSASSKYNAAKTECGGSIDHCLRDHLAASQQKVDDARKSANLSTVMFGVGGAAAIVAAVVWLTAPDVEHHAVAIAPTVGADSMGVAISGAF